MKKAFLCLALSLSSCLAQASVLTGDSVVFQADPGVIAPASATVGAGDEFVFLNFRFDLDAGPGADGFSWVSEPGAGGLAGSTSIVLSDLDFTDGSSLVGFELFTTVLSGLVITTTPDSISFAYTSSGLVGPGPILTGQFLTESAVPTPGTAALMLSALALVPLCSSRKRKAKTDRLSMTV